MGVLTDYFRAADDAAVLAALHDAEGGPLVGGAGAVFDGVEAKGVDPDVVLGQLIAVVRRVEWAVDLVGGTPVWPTTPPPGREGPADEDDPWATGPWVMRLGRPVRDTLAELPEAGLAEGGPPGGGAPPAPAPRARGGRRPPGAGGGAGGGPPP
ncbi:hypothetical protein ACFXAF_16155, partial [Kitasatospora sp. NPDC059463]|uniref:hypothetical protein n=1 Tax=Kitasatospora sp. NPDC059463 TaxID=3346842 RepID=UPI0036865D08